MADLVPNGKTRLLLVEGKEDQEFFIQLGAHLQLIEDWPLHILQCCGTTKLTQILYEIMKSSRFKAIEQIGIVRDADYGTDAFQSVQSAIEHACKEAQQRLTVPRGPLLPSGGTPSISAMIMPSGEREGMLEDLVLDAFQHDPVTSCVDAYFKCLGDSGIEPLPNRLPKARLRAFITGKNVSEAATSSDEDRSYLSDIFHMSWLPDDFWDNPAFNDARTFLTQLLD